MIPIRLVLWASLLAALFLRSVIAAEGHEGAAAPEANAAKVMAHPRSALGVGVAIAPSGDLWLVGLNAEGKLFVQSSHDLGVSWGTPQMLDIGNDTVSADGENRPKLAFGPGQAVVISYTHPLEKPNTGEIRLLSSSNGGKSFSTPVTIHQDRQVITHRFEALAFDRSGVLHTVWIDKRDLTLAMSLAGESTIRSSVYAGAAIYRNESRDGGRSFGPDIKVADHSCECCRIALAATPDGRVAAIWRHVFAPNVRDHAFAVLGDEAKAPVRATFDEWKLDACPHHGPGLALSALGGYHAVWFGDRAGRVGVRYGRLNADGTPSGAVQELPDPGAEHADVVASGKQVVIVWRSYDGAETHVKAWVSADDGTHFALRELAASKDQNDFPRLLATDQGIRVVWRTSKELHVLPVFL